MRIWICQHPSVVNLHSCTHFTLALHCSFSFHLGEFVISHGGDDDDDDNDALVCVSKDGDMAEKRLVLDIQLEGDAA